MALIKCPECGKDVSDKAISCPGCGTPIAEEEYKHEQIINMAAVGVLVGMIVSIILGLIIGIVKESPGLGILVWFLGSAFSLFLTTLKK